MEKYEIFENIKKEIKNNKFDISIKLLEPFLYDKEYFRSSSFELAKIYFELKNYDKVINYLNGIINIKDEQDDMFNESLLTLIKVYKFQNDKNNIYLLIKKIIDDNYNKDLFIEEIYDVIDIYFLRKFLVFEYDGDTDELFKWFQLIKYFIPKKQKYLLALVHIGNFFGFYEFVKSIINSDIIKEERDEYYKNAFLSELEIAEQKIVLESKPRSFWLTLSNKCNLNCFMCKTHFLREWYLLEQDLDYIYSCFPYLEYIVWWGGEPTVVDGFKRVLLDALKYPNIKHRIITNGQYLPDELVEIILKNNIEIVFSVDYIDKESYEKARVGAKFDLLVANMNKLKGKIKKELFKINVVLNKINQENTNEIIKFAEEYGCNNISFIPISGVTNKNLKPIADKYDDTKLNKDKNISVNNAVYILNNNNDCNYETNFFGYKSNKDDILENKKYDENILVNKDIDKNVSNNKSSGINILNNNDNEEKEIVKVDTIKPKIDRYLEKTSELKTEYKINNDEVNKLINKMEEKYSLLSKNNQQVSDNINKAINNIEIKNIKYDGTLIRNSNKFCNIPWYQLSIDYVQDIVPDPVCTCFYKLRLNLQEMYSYADAWNSMKMQTLRKNLLNNNKCNLSCPKVINW